MICPVHKLSTATSECLMCFQDRLQAIFERDARQAAFERGPSRADLEVLQPRLAERDDVNNPAHYTAGSVECIDAIEAALTPEEFRGYLKGNVLKYTWRERHKGGAESMKKAQWYMARWLALAAVVGTLAGCGSDYASPFDKPDVTVMPVSCAASTPCQE